MLRYLLPLALSALALCLAACGTPKCPRVLIQHGMICSHCPDGSVAKANRCVDGDGGLVEPVDTEQDAEVDQPDGEAEPNADAMSALGTAGASCGPDLEQTLACEGHASRKILKCQGGSWQVLQTCAQNERCDSRVGTEQGTCAAIPAACAGKSAGTICDGAVRLECGIDLVNVVSSPCPAHTHCDGASASCACDSGYRDDGKGGCENPDDCPADACKGGKCIDGASDYSCDCDSGYAGTGTKKCTPVLYCPKDACTPGGTCVDVMSWSCQCNTGFTGSGTQTCVNQNDCPSDRCLAPNGMCQDLVGSYKCTCNDGFSGTDCANDLCNPNPCKNGATCSRTGKLCACATGYSGTNCEVDACNPNPCQHGGMCSRTSSGASCDCNGTGYQGNTCETKIDPCAGATNACGGSCMSPLAHQPNESCDNGLLGACRRTGTYVCRGTTTTVCNAPSATAGAEVCGDGVDNDCDGSSDETDATDATAWYEDCDGDGFSALTQSLIASGTGVRRACTKPVASASCAGGWTATRPQAPQAGIPPVNWDCDDTTRAYSPGAAFGFPPEGSTRLDLNCNDVIEKDNGVGQQGLVGGVYSTPLCSLADSCQTCAERATLGGARWLDNNQMPTSAQPRCSASVSDSFPVQTSYYSFSATTASCGGQPNGWFSWPGGGLQLCR